MLGALLIRFSFKVNSDDSSFGNPGRAGYSGLLRNSDGSWIIGYSRHIGRADNLIVELLAVRKSLQIAWNLGYRHMVCEVDCLEVIQLVS